MDKPDVDFIEGLSPAISIDQKSASRNPRSTVGTITEIYDYLRLLYAAHRHPALPELRPGDHPPDAAADRRPRPRAAPTAPASRCSHRSCAGRKGEYEGLLVELAKQGFTRARIDGEVVELSERRQGPARPVREPHHRDRRRPAGASRPGIERRLTDSLETALRLAEGVAEVEIVPAEDEQGRGRDAHLLRAPRVRALRSELRRARPAQLLVQLALRRLPERCDGLGTRFEVDPELVVPDDDLSRRRGRDLTRGAGTAASTSSACSKRSPTRTASRSTPRGRS